MAGSLGNLFFKIGADVKDAVSGINQIERQIGTFQKSLGSLGKGLLGGLTAAGILEIGKQALQASAAFETAFLKIKNLTDSSAADIEKFKTSLGGISRSAGVSINTLADSLYGITSSGATGARALETLEIAAKASAVGMGTTDEVAKALTSTINAYGESNLSAAKAAEIFFKTTKSGSLDMRELTASMSNVTPLAAALGVNLEQVGAFLATASLAGTSASEAVTQLASIFNAVIAPSEQAKKIMDAMGISMNQLQAMIRTDFRGALLELEKGFNGNAEAMAKFFGRKEAVIGFLTVTGQAAGKYGDILKDNIKATVLLDSASKESLTSMEGQWNAAKAIIDNTSLSVGEMLRKMAIMGAFRFKEIINAFKFGGNLLFPKAQSDINRLKEINEQAKFLENINKGLTGSGEKGFIISSKKNEELDRIKQISAELDKIFGKVGENKDKKLDFKTPEELEKLGRVTLELQKIKEAFDDIERISARTDFTGKKEKEIIRRVEDKRILAVPDRLPQRLFEEGIAKQTKALATSWDEYNTKGQQAVEIANAVGAASADAFFNLGSALVEGASGFKALGFAALDAAGQIIKAALAAAIAEAISKSIKKSPHIIVGLALAAVAIGAVKALFQKVPKLAGGGLAYKPQLAIVGDNPNAASDPEVISPLSKLNTMLASQINSLAALLTRSFNQSLQSIYASPANPQIVPLDFRDISVNVKGKIEGNDIRLIYDRAASTNSKFQPGY